MRPPAPPSTLSQPSVGKGEGAHFGSQAAPQGALKGQEVVHVPRAAVS